MLENIIYHAVIVVFILAIFVWLLILQKKMHELRTSLIPFLLEKQFKLPEQRSLFVRGVRTLEQLLSEKFEVPVFLNYDKSRKIFYVDEFKFFADILFDDKKFVQFLKKVEENEKWKQGGGKRVLCFVQSSKTLDPAVKPRDDTTRPQDDIGCWEICIK